MRITRDWLRDQGNFPDGGGYLTVLGQLAFEYSRGRCTFACWFCVSVFIKDTMFRKVA